MKRKMQNKQTSYKRSLKGFAVRLLTAVLLFGSVIALEGCTKASKEKQENTEKQVTENVYRPVFIDVWELVGTKADVNCVYCKDNRIYFCTVSYDEERYLTYELRSIDTEGKDLQKHDMPAFSQPDTYISDMKILKDGRRCLMTNVLTFDEILKDYQHSESIVYISKEGQLLREVKLREVRKEILPDSREEYFTARTTDNEGNIYFVSDNTLCVTDSKGKKLFTQQLSLVSGSSYIEQLMENGSGQVQLFYSEYDAAGSKMYVQTVDLKAKKLTAAKLVPDKAGIGAVRLFCDTQGGYYCSNSVAVYRMDLETGDTTEVLNLINSDISESLRNMQVAAEDCFVAQSNDIRTHSPQLVLLHELSPEEIESKYVLTLAALGVQKELKEAVTGFNRQSSDYRIRIVDYVQYNTPENTGLGFATLKSDLMMGRVPDILVSAFGTTVEEYINKGVFADINQLMEADETFCREDYLVNVFETYEREGRLYELVPYIIPYTLAAKTKHLDGVTCWNMEEFFSFAKTVAPETALFYDTTRNGILRTFLAYCLDDFVDVGSGTCLFDGEDFKTLLRFAKGQKTDDEWQNAQNAAAGNGNYYDFIREDRALFQTIYFYSFSSYTEEINNTFHDEITLVGFPSTNKSKGGIRENIKFLMSATSAHKEGVWEFFRYCLSDAYQEKAYRCFPIKWSTLEKMAAGELENAETAPFMQIITGSSVQNTSGRSQSSRRILTQADIDAVMEMLGSVSCKSHYNSQINTIVLEEAAFYFDDKKEVDAVCEIIQKRVRLLLEEDR